MRLFRLAVVGLPLLFVAASFAQEPAQEPGQEAAPPGQEAPPPETATPQQPPLTPDQLQNLVAPVALYPDTLLSQILVASTYPIEVVEAQQWLQQHRNLTGQQLMDAAQQQNWDPSVQALVAFPDVLARLNQDVRWTTDLGNAFLSQQPDVMKAVQDLRAKAQAAGKLQSDAQQTVSTQTQDGQTAIDIAPAAPGDIYVPNYNPAWVWGPPPYGYYPSLYYPPIDAGFSFFPGVDLGFYFGGGWGLWGGLGWGWGPNWFTDAIVLNPHFFHRYGFSDYHPGFHNVWVHNPGHRLGVPYPNRELAGRFGGAARFGGGQAFRGAEGFRGAENFRGQPAERGNSFAARPETHFAPPERFSGHSAFGGIQGGGVTRMQSDHGFSSMGHSSFGGARGGGFGGGFHGGGGGARGGGGRR